MPFGPPNGSGLPRPVADRPQLMQNTSRAASRQMKDARRQPGVAASAAPVAEPPSKTARPAAASPRVIASPRDRNGHAPRETQPPVLPVLPPVGKPRANIAPVVLFIAQTVCDMIAIGAAF